MAKRDCSELAKKITAMAMNISSRPGVKNLDDVVRRMKEHVPEITREMVVDSIVEATERGPRDFSETINIINAIKAEARQDKALQRKIEGLEKALETGDVPISAKRAQKQATEAIQALRDIRDNLKKKLATSEPGQKAKIEKQIKDLEKRITEEDFTPKIKPAETRKGKELERLEFERDELRRSIQREIQNLKPTAMWEHIAEPFNLARAIMTSYDFSAVFRQGGFVVFSRPGTAAKSLVPMFQAFKSRQKMFEINTEILKRPNAPLYRKAKLFLAPIDGSHRFSQMEEVYQTRWARWIPGVAASERAYLTFINKLRADVFDTMAAGLSRDGEVTLEEARAIANFVNVATGRGNLGALESASVPLNTLFFAPRLTASRFQLLMGQPFFGGNSRTRKAIAKEYARYLIGLSAMFALIGLAFDDDEVDVETSMLSPDFGKIRIGNTRLDPLSGISQTVVVLNRSIRGQTKSTTTGVITALRGDDRPYRGATTLDILTRFGRNKLSPLFGTTVNVLVGTDPVGEPVTVKGQVGGLLTPMAISEVKESIQEQGVPVGTAISLMSVFGMGVMTYGMHYTEMSKAELAEQINKYTHKTAGKREDGTRYFRGQAHKGQEQRVALLRAELDKEIK